MLGVGAFAQQTLKGEVEDDASTMRLERPDNALTGSAQSQGPHSLRISRGGPATTFASDQPLVDKSAFAPLQGNAQDNSAKLGLVTPGAFNVSPSRGFDADAEHGSKELTLAWERWYKQLSAAIYQRWSENAREAGEATVEITVNRSRQLTARVVHSGASESFNNVLLESIESLNGNPGLTFPSQSLRQSVSYQSDYVAGHHVTPGYTWIKNDYEHVQHDY
jgi:hypothetical protein